LGYPDAEVLAKLGVESFEEGLVEVGDRFFFAESIEEGGLDAVKGFSGKVEDFLKLDGVQGSRVGYFSKELAQDGNTQVVSGDAPVEASARRAIFGYATPENPGGKDSVKESLDEGGAKKVLAFLALELDAERLLKSEFDGAEAAERMIFGAGAGFSSVGRQQPGYVSWLD